MIDIERMALQLAFEHLEQDQRIGYEYTVRVYERLLSDPTTALGGLWAAALRDAGYPRKEAT